MRKNAACSKKHQNKQTNKQTHKKKVGYIIFNSTGVLNAFDYFKPERINDSTWNNLNAFISYNYFSLSGC